MLPAFSSNTINFIPVLYMTRYYVEASGSPEPLLLEPGWLGVLAKDGRPLRES